MNTVRNGKGSKNRVSDYKRYSDNYLEINWAKKEPTIQEEVKSDYEYNIKTKEEIL